MDTAHTRAAGILALAFLLSAAPAIAAWNEPSSFEGIPWGASPEEATAIATARGDSMRCSIGTCGGSVDIGPVRAEAWYRFIDGRLHDVHLRFDPKDYAILKQAFIDRYGSPTVERTVMRMAVWQGHTMMIRLFEASSVGGWATLRLYKSLDRQTNSSPLPMRRLMSP
jgi:hypothetical protein